MTDSNAELLYSTPTIVITICWNIRIHTHTLSHSHIQHQEANSIIHPKCSRATEKDRWTPNKGKSWILYVDFDKTQFWDNKFWQFWENKLHITMHKNYCVRIHLLWPAENTVRNKVNKFTSDGSRVFTLFGYRILIYLLMLRTNITFSLVSTTHIFHSISDLSRLGKGLTSFGLKWNLVRVNVTMEGNNREHNVQHIVWT